MLKRIARWLDGNERELNKMRPLVDQINELEPDLQGLTDEELTARTDVFRQRLQAGETLDDLMPEAFAVVREASVRTIGLRHFDVQLMGGMVLHQGRIAEMKTGEGKTLAATLPAYLNALTGQGVHIVTVNDYLAKRDSEWMGRIYRFLGLEVGLILHGLEFEQRQSAYRSDIVFGTNNELGFDYLRDNMALRLEHTVQRPLYYAIVDEVDSILIDEARTPLIISGPSGKPTDLYYRFVKISGGLVPDTDFAVDEKANTVNLTEEGEEKAERMLGIDNLSDPDNIELRHSLIQALKARTLMKRDRDYVVRDGEVVIVDEFTGRLMFGRRYSDGLHQAIEAKEGVKIAGESQTLATVTFQNYFRMYEKLAGMTGTAKTEEDEFQKIYGVDVVVVPTNQPMIRVDHPDSIYRTEDGKFQAVVEEIRECNQRGQPVLVGTVSIEKSERLSQLLRRTGVKHEVLNAKYHDREAEIVKMAGDLGSVTIATNMAGRGTDIVLGGNIDSDLEQLANRDDLTPDEVARREAEVRERWQSRHDRVVEFGGLHVVGTERHEARRIDNQLRGRSGRQGDPGSSRFFLSLEDDLMRLFGSDTIAGFMDRLGMDDSQPIDHALVSRALETAQKRVESRNFDIRKHVLEYDNVINKQRELIYDQRRRVLSGADLQANIFEYLESIVDSMLDLYCNHELDPEEWDRKNLIAYGESLFLPPKSLKRSALPEHREQIRELLLQAARAAYDERERQFGDEAMREIECVVMLRVIDSKWQEHLKAMDDLRDGIGLRAYGQRDPLVEYNREAYNMFQEMIGAIKEDVVRYAFKAQIGTTPRRQPVRRPSLPGMSESGAGGTGGKPGKIGRNAPCPCGSGKKFKKCCGK